MVNITIGNIIKYNEKLYYVINFDNEKLYVYECVLDNGDNGLIPIFKYNSKNYSLNYKENHLIYIFKNNITVVGTVDNNFINWFNDISKIMAKVQNRNLIIMCLIIGSVILFGNGYSFINNGILVSWSQIISFLTIYSLLAGYVISYDKISQIIGNNIINNVLNGINNSKYSRMLFHLLVGENISNIPIIVPTTTVLDDLNINCSIADNNGLNKNNEEKFSSINYSKIKPVIAGFSGLGPKSRKRN